MTAVIYSNCDVAISNGEININSNLVGIYAVGNLGNGAIKIIGGTVNIEKCSIRI